MFALLSWRYSAATRLSRARESNVAAAPYTNEMRLASAEMDALALAACLIAFLVPLIQMLLLSGWLLAGVLKFRLVKYGWRRGNAAFIVAVFHAATATVGALLSRHWDARMERRAPDGRYSLDVVRPAEPGGESAACVVLIPGTWDTSAGLPGYFSELAGELAQVAAQASLLLFKWPATNEAQVRAEAAQWLAARLRERRAAGARGKVVLVGYSHGGTVAATASALLGEVVAHAVVAASAPVILQDKGQPEPLEETHVQSPADLLLAQLDVSHSARRRQFALMRVLRRQLLAGLRLSLAGGVVRMAVALFVLSVLPNVILLLLHLLRDRVPQAFPAAVSLHQLMWAPFVVLGTLFVLWFANPVVEVVYRMLRQALFHLAFKANAPLFSVLFGVSHAEVMAYGFRLRIPRRSRIVVVPGLFPWAAHAGTLQSAHLLDAVRGALRT